MPEYPKSRSLRIKLDFVVTFESREPVDGMIPFNYDPLDIVKAGLMGTYLKERPCEAVQIEPGMKYSLSVAYLNPTAAKKTAKKPTTKKPPKKMPTSRKSKP